MSEYDKLNKILEQAKQEHDVLDQFTQELFNVNKTIIELKTIKYKNNNLRTDLKTLKEKLYENLQSIKELITEEDEEYIYIKSLIERFKINS